MFRKNHDLEQLEIKTVPMSLGHIAEIAEIEQKVFPTPWSKKSFIYELVHNNFAHYLVVSYGDKVVGYGGLWLVLDEGHVTNVAVDPEYQSKKIGEFLLKRLIQLAISLGTERMTLEVRPSNEIAQKLYQKVGFKAKGIRKGYYSDTKEDAIIMWLEDMQNERRSKD